jgi:hypothetical protein
LLHDYRIGFGDICPGETDVVGRIFLTLLPFLGLGFFCGPLLDMASSWQTQVPGGLLALGSFTLALGVSMLTVVEGFSYSEAVHLCVITGKSSLILMLRTLQIYLVELFEFMEAFTFFTRRDDNRLRQYHSFLRPRAILLGTVCNHDCQCDGRIAGCGASVSREIMPCGTTEEAKYRLVTKRGLFSLTGM